ncbi:hypothetical protein BpHYR1_036332 [Brachionus plicatilis]|uniref:RNA-directed DNA polymerase from mobile element jockey-like n=1 Tax=Brachionus plicatilis TaxID=10195 RepID=A0A3M7QGH5_BRAPC|nr:hypothetical protein BpHYR1_036332 [Brachionus plicatilis]
MSLNHKINGNNLNNEEKVKILGITLDSKLTLGRMVDELKECCNSRLNIIKYLSNRKWDLKPKALERIIAKIFLKMKLLKLKVELKEEENEAGK